MAKHRKPAAKAAKHEAAGPKSPAPVQTPAPAPHPPARRPILLAVSVVLFALWFVFLLLTALAS